MIRYALILVLALVTGCSPTVPGEHGAAAKQEQLYIDAKHGFTISHPQNWYKKSIPLSSPNFREDTVAWDIKGNNSKPAEFSISVAPLPQCPDLVQFSNRILNRAYGLKANQTEQYTLPLGEALRGKIQQDNMDTVFISASGTGHCYCLILRGTAEMTVELEPIFSEMAKSLRDIN